jgi:hypothetical protein
MLIVLLTNRKDYELFLSDVVFAPTDVFSIRLKIFLRRFFWGKNLVKSVAVGRKFDFERVLMFKQLTAL